MRWVGKADMSTAGATPSPEAAAQPPVAAPPHRGTNVPRVSQRSWAPLLGGLAVVAATLLFLAFVSTRSDTDQAPATPSPSPVATTTAPGAR